MKKEDIEHIKLVIKITNEALSNCKTSNHKVLVYEACLVSIEAKLDIYSKRPWKSKTKRKN